MRFADRDRCTGHDVGRWRSLGSKEDERKERERAEKVEIKSYNEVGATILDCTDCVMYVPANYDFIIDQQLGKLPLKAAVHRERETYFVTAIF